jgi:hypothetical protein
MKQTFCGSHWTGLVAGARAAHSTAWPLCCIAAAEWPERNSSLVKPVLLYGSPTSMDRDVWMQVNTL